MAFIGPRENQTQMYSNNLDVSSSGNNTQNSVSVNTSDPGAYFINAGYSPSDQNGNYPNNDWDAWAVRCYVNGSQLGSQMRGQEGGIQTYRIAGSHAWLWNKTNSSNQEISVRCNSYWGEGDNDGGGMRGFLNVGIFRLGKN